MPRRLPLLLVLAVVAGCGPGPTRPPASPPAASPVTAGSRFDPATAGTVRGKVVWDGDVPKLPPTTTAIPDGAGAFRWVEKSNPFAPVVNEPTRGLGHAVVYLTGIDPEAGRPWDLAPVRVVMDEHRIVVYQSPDTEGRAGFVRRGDEVEMVSTDPAHHMLRARGAAFFTLPFPDPDRPLRRRLDTPGVVELTSGAGYYWAAADLFVSDHPYYAATDHEGAFSLPRVPPGKYELVCRVRNWHVVGQDRDPETGLVSRQEYAPAVEKRVRVEIGPREDENHTFRFEARDFPVTAGR